MIMAHNPTLPWPLGVGPNNTSIPGAAWLELLEGQAFPVVGAGAMVWNGTMWVPVSTQNRLPVDAAVSGTVAEISSERIALGANPQAIQRATGASKIEIYVESGEVRVRTDGQDATLTTGQPLGAGFMDVFAVDELSVFRVTDAAIITVVHRQ